MVSRRPVVLVFNKFYLPGYRAGGPIRTLANLVARLGDQFSFHIVALDRDSGDDAPYPGVIERTWTTVGDAQVMYLQREMVSIRTLSAIVRSLSPDLLYLNSFFDPIFTQRLLLSRRLGLIGRMPVVLAPRGEFSKGALGLKAFKKRAFLYGASMVGIYRGVIWQASSSGEREDILASLPILSRKDIFEAMNLAPVCEQPSLALEVRSDNEPLKICFLSRISPMKNLDYALSVLGQVASKVIFTIYGPKEVPSYWAECEGLIAELPANVEVHYAGQVLPGDVKTLLSKHHLFFLPTRGENYGHVIHEALSAGLPILISDRTPWGGVVEHGCGWVFSLDDPACFARCIDDFAGWTTDRVHIAKERAVVFARERAVDKGILDANRNLFLRAMNGEFS